MKHTPKPWTYNKVRNSVHHLQYDEPTDNRNQICQMPNKNPETIANAHLISAAPDLLEMVKKALGYITNDNLRVEMGQVIAKAEGGEKC